MKRKITKFFPTISEYQSYYKGDPNLTECPTCGKKGFRSWTGLTKDNMWYHGWDCFYCGFRIDFDNIKINQVTTP